MSKGHRERLKCCLNTFRLAEQRWCGSLTGLWQLKTSQIYFWQSYSGWNEAFCQNREEDTSLRGYLEASTCVAATAGFVLDTGDFKRCTSNRKSFHKIAQRSWKRGEKQILSGAEPSRSCQSFKAWPTFLPNVSTHSTHTPSTRMEKNAGGAQRNPLHLSIGTVKPDKRLWITSMYAYRARPWCGQRGLTSPDSFIYASDTSFCSFHCWQRERQ